MQQSQNTKTNKKIDKTDVILTDEQNNGSYFILCGNNLNSI